MIFLIASLIMQPLQWNRQKAEKERDTVFLSAWMSNPCLSVTDVGDSAAHFNCCSCVIKYPTTVKGEVSENAARFDILHVFNFFWARTVLYYMSAACFSDKRNADLLRLNHVWVLIWGMRLWVMSYVWRPVPDGLIEVWDPWAAAISKQNEACQHDTCPSRRGDKRDGARMIMVSLGSGFFCSLKMILRSFLLENTEKFKHVRQKLCLRCCE